MPLRSTRTARYLIGQIAVLCLLSALSPATAATPDPLREVDTFIGSKDEGNTYPGASAPFGMIQVSPIGAHYAGWRYDDERIRGFGHSFLSGAGCWEQGGQVSVLPVTGSIGPGGDFDPADPAHFDQARYASRYTHEGEVGLPGDYRVRLTDYGGIDVEATALTRAAAERYTFHGGEQGHVLVNVGQATSRHAVVGSEVRVVGDRAVEGKVTTQSFCGGHQYTTWFRIEFDRPFTSFGTWSGEGGVPGSRHGMQGELRHNGAWLSFDLDQGRSVTATSAISHVDAEGARENLRREGMAGDRPLGLEAMRRQAQARWREELRSVRVHGGTAEDRSVFYTALYHALLQPLTGNDADGRYRGYDDAIHRAEGWTYYEYFSLWDTYRSQNPLLALLRPQRAGDIARSILAIHAQGGWLPRWGYANYETNVMTGDPVTPFLVDLWRAGALAGREDQAWQALRQNAYGVPPSGSRFAGRSGNPRYLADGFVQYDITVPSGNNAGADPRRGGSATLEYALADCALAQMAQALGHVGDAADLRRRGGNWRNVWDASVRDAPTGFSGFPRPRGEDGQWYVPADGHYSPRSEHGFDEGTAWQYQWLVPQDVPGLVQALGGREQALRRLDAFFAYDALQRDLAGGARANWVVGAYSYFSQYRYNPNNEPDLHAPWMYTLFGQPWKTTTVLRAARALFTQAPDGVTGNDDLGTMSAWYLFSAIGLYPAVPGSGQFLLHAPAFERVELDLGEGRTLRIDAPGSDPRRLQYVQGVRVDGRAHAPVWIGVDRLRQGGRIDFALTGQVPVQGWGTRPEDAPVSFCAAPGGGAE
ncbi:MAG: GH92 family glycosyl hydrolase [Pseudomonas sp.]